MSNDNIFEEIFIAVSRWPQDPCDITKKQTSPSASPRASEVCSFSSLYLDQISLVLPQLQHANVADTTVIDLTRSERAQRLAVSQT
jgi:hypothetical protein